MGWIFDINFAPTFESINKRHYLEMILHVLPESEKIEDIFSVIQTYLDKKLKYERQHRPRRMGLAAG